MGHYKVLCEREFPWEEDKYYAITVKAEGAEISASCEGAVLSFCDTEDAYLQGAVGVSVESGSHICLESIAVKGKP